MHSMRSLLVPTVVVSFLLAVCTCVTSSPASAQGPPHLPGEVGPLDDLTVAPPPPPVETPTVVTFYANEDLTGASYSVEVMPTSGFEATRIVSTNELTTAGLPYTISSVRLACGTRPSRVSLFDIDWSEFSDGTSLECTPIQTVTINLAAQLVPVSDGLRDLNDKVGAAVITAHVRSSDDGVHANEFSFLFGQAWKTRMNSLENATNDSTRIWTEAFHTVRVEQHLKVDHWACTERGAVFDLRIIMTVSNFRPVFNVIIVSEYVDYGFGDGFPTYCHENYLAALHANLELARSELKSQLPEIFSELLSSGVVLSPTFYFVPQLGTQVFQAFYWK